MFLALINHSEPTWRDYAVSLSPKDDKQCCDITNELCDVTDVTALFGFHFGAQQT